MVRLGHGTFGVGCPSLAGRDYVFWPPEVTDCHIGGMASRGRLAHVV
jgi:hypothetical protein